MENITITENMENMTTSEAFKRLIDLINDWTGGSEAALKFLQAYKKQAEFDLRLMFKLDYKNKQAIATLLKVMGREEYWEICKLIPLEELEKLEEARR